MTGGAIEPFSRFLDQPDLTSVFYLPPRKRNTVADPSSEKTGRHFFQARLIRRGVNLGTILQTLDGQSHKKVTRRSVLIGRALWNGSSPYVIERVLSSKLPSFAKEIRQSLQFLDWIRGTGDAQRWLEKTYATRLKGRFQIAASIADLGDDLEVQKIYLDAIAREKVLTSDLFIKVNYLSSHPKDGSLRLRFSFGEEAFRSWKAWERDQERSYFSAQLAEAIFPESKLVTCNKPLRFGLKKIIGQEVEFPERIVYSNAPNGGAFFHHDFVRSHCGVIFAQLHGITGWLALPGTELIRSIQMFLADPRHEASLRLQFRGREDRTYVKSLASDRGFLRTELERKVSGPLTDVINNNPEFIASLIQKGAMRILRPGDVILLPAPRLKTATWHSVFCLDNKPGLSLSFAMKRGLVSRAG